MNENDFHTWNYRILKTVASQETYYEVHEVYYDSAGAISAWTENPVKPRGDSQTELLHDILYFVSAFTKPVLVETVVDGKSTLVPVPDDATLNPGHSTEAMDRAAVAMLHFGDFVGSHPMVRRDSDLRAAAERVSEVMYHFYSDVAQRAFSDNGTAASESGES